MAGPWEKYQPAAPVEVRPWEKYRAADAAPSEAEPRGWGQDLLRAGVMTGRNVLHGALALPEMLHDATVMPAYNAIAEALGSDSRINPGGQQIDAALNAVGVPNPQPENGTERVVSGIDRGLGGLLSGVGLGSLLSGSGNAATAGVGNALTSSLGAQTAATAAGTGSSELVREGGGSPATQLAFGLAGGLSPAALGATKQGVVSGIGRLLSEPSPEAAQLGRQALDMGIPLKASQVSPSKVAKLLDSVSGQVPFSGAQSFQNTQQQAFNRAVGRTIEADSPVINAPVFEKAKSAASNAFDRMWANNAMPVNQPVLKRAVDVVNMASTDAAPDVGHSLGAILDEVATKGATGALPGRAFQSIDSRLGSMAAGGGEKGHFAGELQEVLRDAMQSGMSASDQQRLGEIRGVWRNLKTVEPLVSKNAVEGDISPAQLLGRVNANRAGKSAMATGRRGDLGDLANVGQRFIKQQIPDSGTAQRVFAGKALGSLGSLGGGVAAGSLLGPAGGLATLASAVGGSRATQALLQNPALVKQLLGRSNPNDLGRLLMLSADPTAQAVIQPGQ